MEMPLPSWGTLGSDCHVFFLNDCNVLYFVLYCIVLNVTIVKTKKVLLLLLYSVGGMTVEVRTCIAGSLLISSVACLLVWGL